MDESGNGPKDEDLKPTDDWGNRSGVFNVKKVREVVADRREEADSLLHEVLARQDLYNRRAEIRNDLRSWFERTPFLAKTFKIPYIPKMYPAEIAEEDRMIVERKAVRIARKNKNDLLMRQVHTYVQAAETPLRDSTQVELEEKAKYFGVKLRKLFVRNRFEDAVKFVNEHKKDFPYPHEAEYFTDVVYEECRAFLQWINLRGAYEVLPAALDSIAQMTQLEREDFYYLQVNLQSAEEKQVFVDKLCEAMEQHPAIYLRMRETFMDLGFIDGPEVDKHPAVHAAMISMLREVIKNNPEIYESYLFYLHRAKIVRGEDIHQSEEIQTTIKEALLREMKANVFWYVRMRDRLAKRHMIDREDFNFDPDIQAAALRHFDEWHEKGPKLYQKFKILFNRYGVYEPEEISKKRDLEEEKEEKEGSLFEKIYRGASEFLFLGAREEFATRFAEGDNNDQHFLKVERVEKLGQLREFVKKYPMFRKGPKKSSLPAAVDYI